MENFNNASEETDGDFVRAFYCRHYMSIVSNSAERVDIGGWYGIMEKALKTEFIPTLYRVPVAAEKSN